MTFYDFRGGKLHLEKKHFKVEQTVSHSKKLAVLHINPSFSVT